MQWGDERIAESLWPRVVPEPNTGCWLWIGATTVAGYGIIQREGQRTTAHRWFWQKLVGRIPAGMELDHVQSRGCGFRCCVNPRHLEVVTKSVNNSQARMSPQGRAARARWQAAGCAAAAEMRRRAREAR